MDAAPFDVLVLVLRANAVSRRQIVKPVGAGKVGRGEEECGVLRAARGTLDGDFLLGESWFVSYLRTEDFPPLPTSSTPTYPNALCGRVVVTCGEAGCFRSLQLTKARHDVGLHTWRK